MSNVATQPKAEIAPLYDRNTFDVDAGDFALPKVYICQQLTQAVGAGIAKVGDVITAVGPDDPDAEVIYESKTGGEGILFHVLRLDKGLSYSENKGPLQTWAFGDPEAHPDAWVTYYYTLALPEIDSDMPYKFLMTRTNMGTAKRVNTQLGAALRRGGNLYDPAFRLTTEQKQKDQYKWHGAVVKSVPATADGVSAAEALSDMVNTNAPPQAALAASSEAPAI